MAKKGKNQQKQTASKHVTTRRLARWQREKRRQRITFLSGIVIIVAVLGIIVGGVVATRSSDWLSKVETDSGTVTVKKADYADELKAFVVGEYIYPFFYNTSTMTSESLLSMIETQYLTRDKTEGIGLEVSKTEVDNVILTFLDMPNASISDSDVQQRYNGFLGNFSISDDDFRGIIEKPLLNAKLHDYYLTQIPESGEQVAVQTMIVSNESTAHEVTQMWRSGLDFETLAETYGDMSDSGWLIKGTMEEVFDNVAFSIEIGNISDPIASETEETSYYIIKVQDRKDGPIDETLRQDAASAEYQKWLYQAYADKVERNPKIDMAEVYAWAIEQLQ